MSAPLPQVTFAPPTMPEAPMTDFDMSCNVPVGMDDVWRRWQSTGIRLMIDLPFVSDDRFPLFAIRANPFFPRLPAADAEITNMSTAFMYYSPVYPLPGTTKDAVDQPKYKIEGDNVVYSPVKGVYAVAYDNPGPFSTMSTMYRYWRGSIMYRLRCLSNFTVSGYMLVSSLKKGSSREMICDGTTILTDNKGYTTIGGRIDSRIRKIQELGFGYRTHMLNSYDMSDLSMFRHMQETLPFECNQPWFDQYQFFKELYEATHGTPRAAGSSASYLVPPVFTTTSQFLVIANRGAITSPTDGAQLSYELEYCPGPDFEFSGELFLNRAPIDRVDYGYRSDKAKVPFVFPAQEELSYTLPPTPKIHRPALINFAHSTYG